MLKFIDPKLDVDRLRESLASRSVHHEVPGIGNVPVLDGAVVVADFLTPEARQHIEGQVYSSGTNLAEVYKTSRTGYGDNELNITEADRQIPLIGELRAELDSLLERIFPGEITAHALQLRELTPKASGHSRHVDYEKGFDVMKKDGRQRALTSLSLSLPISWNDGRAPVFIMETAEGKVLQGDPGSLAIFGPQIYHSHPPTTDFDKPYLWLVTQAFFRDPFEVRSSAGEGTLASWASRFLKDRAALETLEVSERRIQRAYAEILSGYEVDPTTILNEVERVESYSGVVVERDIQFTSLCGHHFLPFYGTIDVAYEPNEVITGLGKIPRLVRALSRRLQLQELLIQEIAEQIMSSLDAKGACVVARANHLCIHSRGPLSPGSQTVCTYAVGSLESHYRGRALDSIL